MIPGIQCKNLPLQVEATLSLWKTHNYQIHVIASDSIRALVRSLETGLTYPVDISASFSRLAPQSIPKNKLQNNFYPVVVRSNNIPVRVEFHVRGSGGMDEIGVVEQKFDKDGNPWEPSNENANTIQSPETKGNRTSNTDAFISDVEEAKSNDTAVPHPHNLPTLTTELFESLQTKHGKALQELYIEALKTYIEKFSALKEPDQNDVDNLVQFVRLNDTTTTRTIFNALAKKINQGFICEPHVIYGITSALNNSDPRKLNFNPEDCLAIAQMLLNKIPKDRPSNHAEVIIFLRALVQIFNAINKTEDATTTASIKSALQAQIPPYDTSPDEIPFLLAKSLAAYASKSLGNIDNNETTFAAIRRIFTPVAQGVGNTAVSASQGNGSAIIQALIGLKNSLDLLNVFKEELRNKVTQEKNFLNISPHELEWFQAIKCVEHFIDTKQFDQLFKMLPLIKISEKIIFLCLVVNKLDRVILTYQNTEIQKLTIKYLADFIYNNALDWHYERLTPSDFEQKKTNKCNRSVTTACHR